VKKLTILNGMIHAFLLLPIWLYLLHSLLTAANATDVQWLLFYVYVPLHLFVSFVNEIVKKDIA